jgi:DNA-directed RNA polymerase subunit RPC12/RpoP
MPGCVGIRLSIKCTECEQPVPVNGPTERAKCSHCQSVIALKGRLRWEELLDFHNPNITVFEFAARAKSGAEERGAWAPVSLTALPQWPKCACGSKFSEAATRAAVTAGAALSCTKCRKALAVSPVPAFFAESFPCATHTVGAAAAMEGSGGPGGATSIKCASCGAHLPLDGASRVVECRYCHASATLGDDIWLALHPVATKQIWWVVFDPTPLLANRASD